MNVTVKNLSGSSNCKRTEVWINVWLKCKKLEEWNICLKCEEEGDVDGGHVHTIPDDGFCYIVPLCPSCNNPENTDPFEVDKKALVRIRPAEQSKYERVGICAFREIGICLPLKKLKRIWT